MIFDLLLAGVIIWMAVKVIAMIEVVLSWDKDEE